MTHTNLAGTTLGRFEFLDERGQGGMAVVYRARQTDLDRIVALKILHPHLTHDAETVRRFQQEARHAAALDHPHIVPIYDIGELPLPTGTQLHYIAMKYVAGTTVKDLLERQGRFDLRQAADLLAQVGSALAFAHQRGIIHRDVKPSNMLVSNEGVVYLSDFGLAYAGATTGRLTRTGMVMGTPEYMSPEQAEGQTELHPATDRYALGVVLYEMLTCDLPFEADTPMDMAVARLMHEPRAPRSLRSDLSPDIEGILLRALARNPQERFSSIDAFINALRIVAATHTTAPDKQTVVLEDAPSTTGQTIVLPRDQAETEPRQQPINALPVSLEELDPITPQDVAMLEPDTRASQPTAARSAEPFAAEKRRRVSPLVATLVMIGVPLLAIVLAISALFLWDTETNPAMVPTVFVPPTPAAVGATPASGATAVPVDNAQVAALLETGWTHFDAMRYNDAMQAFIEAREIAPDNPQPYYGLGRVLMSQNRYSEAAEQFNGAIQRDHDVANYHAWLGEASLNVAVLNDTPAQREVAELNYQQAEDSFRRALSRDDTNTLALTGLGWVILAQSGDYTEARDLFEQALALDETQSDAYRGLGWLAYNQQDYTEARTQFQQSITLDPENVDAYHGLGRTFEALNRPGEARVRYMAAMELDPDNEIIQERLEQLDPVPQEERNSAP